MKKLFLLLAATTLLTRVNAQTTFCEKLDWGVQVGVQTNQNFINLESGDSYVSKMIPQFTGGLFATYNFNSLVGLSMEVNYSNMSVSTRGYYQNMQYITVPIIAQINVFTRGDKYIKAYAGLTPSFKISPVQIIELNGGINPPPYYRDPIYDLQYIHGQNTLAAKKFDLMVTAGFRFGVYKGLFIDVRANAGMLNVTELRNLKSYNNPISLTVGWKF